jgi:hypothetical protein
MAQHDYNLANQSGADFRADLNNALSAIATVNSGATEPSTTFAHQLWVDTSSNVLKIRNAANNDWITTGVSITASNTFTGNITGNADTATTLATARTINGTSFDGSANISFDTDSVSEGSSNLYFTNERVDDQVNTLLQAGTGIQLTYDDTAGTLTIANTNDADITGVVAGNGLTGGGTAGTVTLNVAVDDSSIEIDSDALQVKALGITNAMLAGSIANAKLVNASVTINSNALSLGGTLTLDTDDIGEGSTNLYYTDARANTVFDTRLATKDTDDLSEGTSNLYYTQTRFDSAFTAKSTSDLSEGTNLYYTDARARASISEDSTQLSYNSTTGVLSFTQGDTDTVSEGSSNLYYTSARANADFDTRLATKSTSDLSEGTNLYYTTTRFDSAFAGKDTDDLSEGSTNVYYTDARSRSAISASGDISYDSSTGVISFTQSTAPVTSVNTQTGAVVLDTDDVSEGSANFYYTDTRANSAIDTRVTKAFVDALGIQASSVDANSVALGTDTTGNYVATITGTANKVSVSGSGSESAAITLSLPDDVQIADSLTVAGNLTVNGTLTSLDTTNLDIEDNLFQLNAGLTGSPVNDSGMLINRGDQHNGIFMWDESVDKFTLGLTTADGTSTGNITLSSLGTLVANIEGDVTGAVTGTVSSISNHSTSDLSEGTNLYYTDARFDTRLGTKDTDDLSEGSSNLYYTTTRFNSAFSGKSTSDLSEGSNLYYTSARANSDFDTRLATKDTGDLSEGSNLYYTDARVQAVSINNVVEDTTPQLGGDLASNGNDILFADSDKAIFGAGSDLQIYHDGSNSRIQEAGTGSLLVRGTNLQLQDSDGYDYLTCTDGGNGGTVALKHLGSTVLNTTSTGIDVTGTVVADGLTVDTSTLVVDSTNNRVGIGTSSPTEKLTVNGALAITGALVDDRTSTAAMDFSGGVTRFVSYGASGTGGEFAFRTASGGASSIERLRVDSLGNLIMTAGGTIRAGGVNDLILDAGESGTPDIYLQSGGATKVKIEGSNGNVGIGVTSPQAILHVSGVAPTYTNVATVFYGGTTNNGVMNGVSLWSSGDALNGGISSNLLFANSNTPSQTNTNRSSGTIYFGNTTTASRTSDMIFGGYYKGTTSFIERVRIDGLGAVGIGTTSLGTESTLHIGKPSGAGGAEGGQLVLQSSTNGSLAAHLDAYSTGGADYLRLLKGTDTASTGVHSVFDLTNTRLGIGTSTPDAPLHVEATNASVVLSDSGRGQWWRIQNEESTDSLRIVSNDVNERLRIDSEGNVLVGTTTKGTTHAYFSSASNDRMVLFLGTSTTSGTGVAVFQNPNGTVGSIRTSGSSTSFNTSSDYRLKENVDYEFNALDRVVQLKPARFNFIADADTTVDGFLAHEVQDIVPEAITGEKDAVDDEGNPEYQGIDQSKLVPLLTKAIQEQQAQIEALQSEINLLKRE